MESIDQHTALEERGTFSGEETRYWRADRFDGLECLAARFVSHRYAPHTHDTYAIGAILSGCETFMVGGSRHYAWAGDLVFVHPDVVHDGEPLDEGYAYRMTYPTVELVRELASDISGRRVTGTPSFRAPIIRDPQAAAAFISAHRALAEGDVLRGDERYLAAMALLLKRHCEGIPMDRPGSENRAVARARDYLDANYAERVDLPTLAGIAGFSRFHLVRAFRRDTGLTPHAWLTDRRVRAARRLLSEGVAPGEVAGACGFADQSHLTRAFKARVGVTPGRYARAQLHAA